MKKYWLFLSILLFAITVVAVETEITVLTASESALNLVNTGSVDEVNGFRFNNFNGDVMAAIQNANSNGLSTAAITFTPQLGQVFIQGYGSLTKAAVTVNLVGGSTAIVGPFAKGNFNNSSSMVVGTVTGNGSTQISITPFRWNPANH